MRTRLAWMLPAFLLSLATARSAEPTQEEKDFFEKKVRPVLVEHCQRCHGEEKQKGGLRLDSRVAMLKGGDNGPSAVPGKPDVSLIIKAINYQDEPRMPPKTRLTAAAVADLTAWVKMGAPWPDDKGTVTKTDFDLAERKKFWCWQPVKPGTVPEVKNRDWPLAPSDAFLLRALEARSITPAPAADKRTLIRRLTFDLTGMPPTPEEVEAFVKDAAPEAYEKAVDRLLASPRYGERWGRHWLDLVRYGESRGHEFDYTTPNAYQYRDYVIRALNADVPYNQFVTEHVAGDLIGKPRLHPTEGFNESILGTGFYFLGEEVHSPVDIRQDQADRYDNRIDVLSKTFLGLTVSCARCHDHKFDAIPTRDYYSLFSFLESSSYRLVRFDSLEQNRQVARELTALRDQSRPKLQKALADGVRPTAERLAEYLLASREAILAGPEFDVKNPGTYSAAYLSKLDEIAQARKLDSARLAAWVTYLLAAAKDDRDPLHAWARIAANREAGEAKGLADLLRPMVESGRKRQTDAAAAFAGSEIVVDYSKPTAWMPDDVSFGPGSQKPGDIRFGTDPARPMLGFVEQGIAARDPFWDGLKVAPGSDNDPGSLGQQMRAGRTLKTPTFKLNGTGLFYLVRGSGMAYAAVGNHVMLAGPLHGRLITPIKPPEKTGDRFYWVSQDLRAYQGQNVHIEFTGNDGSDFAVAMVVQGERAPNVGEAPNALTFNLLDGDSATSVDALAAGHARALTDLIDRLATDRLAGSPDRARLANWLWQRRNLFLDDEATRNLDDTAAAFGAAQAKLATQIRKESRLALAMLDGEGMDGRVFIRGGHKSLGIPAPRRFLEAFVGETPLSPKQSSGRLELARDMTDPAVNPLIGRVMVNRVWHHLFGRGLVASVDNFGVLGEKPTNPELLDYLADRFVRDGWSVKKLIRQLVLSRAYQMSSRADAQADAADPENLLLHRTRLRRLEGEAIRDAILSVSGRLDEKHYGPSVPVFLTEFQEGRGRPASGPLDGNGRRSIYLGVRRNFLSSFLLAFDTPIPFSTVGKRTVSNVPAQALILMNDPFVHQQADVWAKKELAKGGTAKERIERMYLQAFARPPSEKELAAALGFLDEQAKASGKTDDPKAWADLGHVLFNVKEFIFLN